MAQDKSTRERLLAAALELVASDGVQSVSHRSVEERAGVARGSTRYYFGTRDALLEALIAHLAERDHAFIAAAAAQVPGGAIGERQSTPDNVAMLEAAVNSLLADRDGALARFELYLYAARRPELEPILTAWGKTFIDVAAAHLRAHGAQDPEAAGAFLSAAMDGMIFHSLIGGFVPQKDLGAALYRMTAGVAELPNAQPSGDRPSGDSA